MIRLAALALLVLVPPLATQATYTTHRQSCPGALGPPQLIAGAPVVASPWTLTVTGLSPNTAGALFLALRDDVLGSSTLPLDLGFMGAPGCFVNVNIDAAAGAFAHSVASDGTGQVTFTVTFPNAPGVLGSVFYNQYVSLEAPAGRTLPITTTNAGRGVVGVPGVPNMVPIAAGSFLMGSNDPVSSSAVERPVHTVNITRPFWIGKYEVTQAEYQAVMGTNPSYWIGWNPNPPLESVTWYEAMAYSAALTAQERAAGRLPAGYQYRLPTEAEWEYCCRAGTTTEWNVGSSLSCGQANYNACGGQPTSVGSYAANPWGLHDTHGNVWEWCLDSWDGSANYPTGPVNDPYVTSGAYRVFRGGSWADFASGCRSALRRRFRPDGGGYVGGGPLLNGLFGFRVVLAPVLVP